MTDATADSEFVTVAHAGDIPAGQGQAFAVNGRMVAVFNENGAVELASFSPSAKRVLGLLKRETESLGYKVIERPCPNSRTVGFENVGRFKRLKI